MTNLNDTLHLDERLAERLRAHARICETIASLCWSEDVAGKFETMAKKCNDAAAATATTGKRQSVRAAWPNPNNS